MARTCGTCHFDGFCFLSVELPKLFDGVEYVELFDNETGELTTKGDQFFALLADLCENYSEVDPEDKET